MLTDLQQRAVAGELSPGDVAQAMAALLDPAVSDEPKAAFLRAWAQRGETAGELAACAHALLPRAVDPGVRGTWNGKPLLDCCGTGGGGLNLLNISTGVVFILAAMGIPVVKHGNRGLTKKSGSADVLEALGIRIDLPPERLVSCLEEVGAAFLFAPAFHTSFSVLAPVRRQLGAEGQRTVFNLLGPLLNPARPDARLVGVFSEAHLHLYFNALNAIGCPHFAVACGEDATGTTKIGEVSADGKTWIAGTRRGPDGQPPPFMLSPSGKPEDQPRVTPRYRRGRERSPTARPAIATGGLQSRARDAADQRSRRRVGAWHCSIHQRRLARSPRSPRFRSRVRSAAKVAAIFGPFLMAGAEVRKAGSSACLA